MKTYVVGTHLKRLKEALQMSTHDICFNGEIRKNITHFWLKMFLNWSYVSGVLNRPKVRIGLTDVSNISLSQLAKIQIVLFFCSSCPIIWPRQAKKGLWAFSKCRDTGHPVRSAQTHQCFCCSLIYYVICSISVSSLRRLRWDCEYAYDMFWSIAVHKNPKHFSSHHQYS